MSVFMCYRFLEHILWHSFRFLIKMLIIRRRLATNCPFYYFLFWLWDFLFRENLMMKPLLCSLQLHEEINNLVKIVTVNNIVIWVKFGLTVSIQWILMWLQSHIFHYNECFFMYIFLFLQLCKQNFDFQNRYYYCYYWNILKAFQSHFLTILMVGSVVDFVNFLLEKVYECNKLCPAFSNRFH